MESIFLVQSDPVPGRADEYLDWYQNRHLHDVLQVRGFTAAQLFRIAPAQRPGAAEPSYKHVAIYEMEGSVAAAMTALDRAIERGMPISDAMHPGRTAHAFTAVGPRLEA